MISKQIKPEHIQTKDRQLKPWEKKVQAIAGYLSTKPILKRIDLLDDLEMFSISESLGYLVNRTISSITFRPFRSRMKKGLEYFKRGYNTFDFDSFHALDDFMWKLERLAKILDENDRHYGDKDRAKEIREVLRLLNRVIEDDYHDEFEKELEEKYGASIRYTARSDDFMNEDRGPFKNKHTGAIVMWKREKETPENYKEIHKAERMAYIKADKKRKNEWKKALNIIEKHLFEWWD